MLKCPFVRADATPIRHVLGASQKRPPFPERDMSAASTAVLRLLLHMSMYLGAAEQPQVSVCSPVLSPYTPTPSPISSNCVVLVH